MQKTEVGCGTATVSHPHAQFKDKKNGPREAFQRGRPERPFRGSTAYSSSAWEFPSLEKHLASGRPS